MADQRVGILLYKSTPFIKKCDARIPENIDFLELSFIYELRHNNVFLYRFIQTIDIETEKLQIYTVRPGTRDEYEKCMA